METMSLGYALLAVQRSLLGEVTPELRAVVVDINRDEEVLFIRCYYDKEVSEKQIDLWQCAMMESDVGTCMLDGEVKRLDYPQEIPLRGQYAYYRKEPVPLVPVKKQVVVQVQREWVDFPEKIGVFVSPIPDDRMETQRGVRHNTKSRCCIVPGIPSTFTIDAFPLAYAMLSMQKALIRIIVKELIAIVVDLINETLYVRFYYEGKVSCEIIEDWEYAMTQAWADLGPEYILDGKIEQMIFPTPIPSRGRLAYNRKEEQRDIPCWPITA